MSQLLSSPPVTTSPESELAPLLTAWDLAHPATADPDWRHLLDELAHPRTTQAFHSLATSTT
ncbi:MULTISPECIES: hypothetical protein [unclassified Streptomyces]|jgi:hypothetical protein|uniref:hypothetical protein n=1 Tax=unclassified Streptomyces TaxID=2593676 RepID=UPI000F4EBE64|nr:MULTISPECIES: hypothetical protein [unclassified Streptomyces]MDH6451305.1 hypothetical protein [Streptomyces sp. SAI-119]MDH6498136.1 hypothetical protein [Streptomyces sp. SAI-149]QUC63046.1 hypothetical protein IOD14_43375 [Streptomyces sp. A2-16]GLP70623.1 hypothetical protein TUSST3_72430 [Streptomyces sp. TUS-ST3]